MGERRGYEGEGKGVGESLRGYEGGSSASGMHRQRDAIGCGVLAAPPPFPLPGAHLLDPVFGSREDLPEHVGDVLVGHARPVVLGEGGG